MFHVSCKLYEERSFDHANLMSKCNEKFQGYNNFDFITRVSHGVSFSCVPLRAQYIYVT